jgi:predicted RNase H-like nuclease
MRTVLGIDAAWTATNPSGLALVEEVGAGWRLRAVEPSYGHFHASAPEPRLDIGRPIGSRPDVAALLATCRALTGQAPDLVAVDMPLSRRPIIGRRASDIAVSVAYGARKCATHSPSAERPGPISDALRADFAACAYPLWTAPAPSAPALATPGLIEVYPHPALVELTGASERLPYKISRIGKYWPDLKPPGRRERLLSQWRRIVAALEDQIEGVSKSLPEIAEGASGLAFKSYEDALDAIVCAWVGVCALEGVADAYGDVDSAIWIPSRERGWPSWRARS